MKKFISLLVCITVLLTLAIPMALPAGAMGDMSALITNVDTLEYPAPDIAAIEAGEADAGELPAIKTPTLDGVISQREYHEMDLIEAAQLMGVFCFTNYWSAEELAAFADVCNTLIPYWGAGWDGKYLYLAYEVNTADIAFYNGLTGDNVYLFANTCFQVGVADVDATGNDYSETGYGISTAEGHEGQPVSFSWLGDFTPVSGTDFACSWDQNESRAVYEIRINLGEALGHTVESGSQIKLAWCFMIGEGYSNTDAIHSLMYAHGITGRMSGKNATAFAKLTLTGDPENVGDIVELTEEQKKDREYGLKNTIDFSLKEVADSFYPQKNNASVTHMTEGEVSFTRFSATEKDALIVNDVYPKGLNADLSKYVAIRYRTSTADMDALDMTYLNEREEAGYEDNYVSGDIYNDGNWRTLVLDLNGEPCWYNFVSKLGVILQKGDIDIQWIKFFTDDVWEYYAEEPPADQTATDTEAVTTGSEPASETQGDGTEAPTNTEAVTTAGAAATTADGGAGCGSVLALPGVCALAVALGGVVLLKKKH